MKKLLFTLIAITYYTNIAPSNSDINTTVAKAAITSSMTTGGKIIRGIAGLWAAGLLTSAALDKNQNQSYFNSLAQKTKNSLSNLIYGASGNAAIILSGALAALYGAAHYGSTALATIFPYKPFLHYLNKLNMSRLVHFFGSKSESENFYQ